MQDKGECSHSQDEGECSQHLEAQGQVFFALSAESQAETGGHSSPICCMCTHGTIRLQEFVSRHEMNPDSNVTGGGDHG
eukprot:4592854-Prymnesium_polylepis.1